MNSSYALIISSLRALRERGYKLGWVEEISDDSPNLQNFCLANQFLAAGLKDIQEAHSLQFKLVQW
jgi:hypothetical protein